ncbi:MAG: glycosyltransferase family 4 protein [Phycisphaerae bacterium]
MVRKENTMLVYACLPSYRLLEDRYRMFAEMCGGGVRVRIVLLHGEHPPISNFPPGLERFCLPDQVRGLARAKYMRKLIVPAPWPQRTVIHDTFLGQMSLIMRNRWTIGPHRGNLINVLSLYSPTPGFFLKGKWLTGPNRIRPADMFAYVLTEGRHLAMEFASCHFADGIVGNTEEIVAGVRRYYGIPADRTRFMPAEVDPDFFTPGPARRKELNLPAEDKIILYVGNFQRRKGFDLAISTFENLASRIPATRLVAVGRMPEEPGVKWSEDILRSSPAASRIDVRDRVERGILRDLYRSADVLFLPSRSEGSPRVVKEAMSCGLPVVSSGIPGLQAVDPGEECVVQVRRFDPVSFSDALARLLSDDAARAKRIEAGRRLVARDLSTKVVAQRMLRFYDELFDSRRRRASAKTLSWHPQ